MCVCVSIVVAWFHALKQLLIYQRDSALWHGTSFKVVRESISGHQKLNSERVRYEMGTMNEMKRIGMRNDSMNELYETCNAHAN